MYLKLALKFGPYIAIALLIGFLLYQRGNLATATGERDAALVHAAQLAATNAANQRTMQGMAAQRIDNDAIATAVATRLQDNQVREVHTQTVIREAIRNDPTVRTWADSPIPDSVRSALAAPGGRVPPPAR